MAMNGSVFVFTVDGVEKPHDGVLLPVVSLLGESPVWNVNVFSPV
jgi:hypothetical protein